MEPEHHSHRFFPQLGVSTAQLLDYAKRACLVGSMRLLRHSRMVLEGGALPEAQRRQHNLVRSKLTSHAVCRWIGRLRPADAAAHRAFQREHLHSVAGEPTRLPFRLRGFWLGPSHQVPEADAQDLQEVGRQLNQVHSEAA